MDWGIQVLLQQMMAIQQHQMGIHPPSSGRPGLRCLSELAGPRAGAMPGRLLQLGGPAVSPAVVQDMDVLRRSTPVVPHDAPMPPAGQPGLAPPSGPAPAVPATHTGGVLALPGGAAPQTSVLLAPPIGAAPATPGAGDAAAGASPGGTPPLAESADDVFVTADNKGSEGFPAMGSDVGAKDTATTSVVGKMLDDFTAMAQQRKAKQQGSKKGHAASTPAVAKTEPAHHSADAVAGAKQPPAKKQRTTPAPAVAKTKAAHHSAEPHLAMVPAEVGPAPAKVAVGGPSDAVAKAGSAPHAAAVAESGVGSKPARARKRGVEHEKTRCQFLARTGSCGPSSSRIFKYDPDCEDSKAKAQAAARAFIASSSQPE